MANPLKWACFESKAFDFYFKLAINFTALFRQSLTWRVRQLIRVLEQSWSVCLNGTLMREPQPANLVDDFLRRAQVRDSFGRLLLIVAIFFC